MATRAEVEEAEIALREAREGPNWMLCPTENKRLKMSREEYLSALRSSRIGLKYREWTDANEAAKRLSEVGGVADVIILSVKKNAVATFDNGEKVFGAGFRPEGA